MRRPRAFRRVRRQLLLGFFIGTGAFLVAHGINGVVEERLVLDSALYGAPTEENFPTGHQSHWGRQTPTEAAERILSSGLFAIPAKVETTSSARLQKGTTSTSLNLSAKITVLGIALGLQNSGRAIILDLQTQQQAMYRTSEHVPGVGQLMAIEKERVLFREGMIEEWLELAIVPSRASTLHPPLTPVLKAEAGSDRSRSQPGLRLTRRSIARHRLLDMVTKPEAWLTEAQFQPHFNHARRIDGFQVEALQHVGALEQVGLQNSDVLTSINGVEVRDPARLWEMLRLLSQEHSVQLHIVRNGQPVTLVVDIRG